MLENTSALVKDLVSGDESVATRDDFLGASLEEIQKALAIIINNKNLRETDKKYLSVNLWRAVYKSRPPTPEEFLTAAWIGPTALAIRPWVREAFLEITKPDTPYKDIILNQAIRVGKSYLTMLLVLYTNTLLYLMRDPKKLFNLSESTVICSMFISFSESKTKELLVEPFVNTISTSEKFWKCRTLEQMRDRMKDPGSDRICWTTAGGGTNILTLGNNGNLKVSSNPSKLLGLAIITGALSELSFFKERGYTDDKIMNLYNSLKQRVHTSFPQSFLAKSILDCSPMDASNEATLDYWISHEAPKNPKNYILQGPQWQYNPAAFPQYQRDGLTFPVFKGSSTEAPRILEERIVESYSKLDILRVPLELKSLFEDDLSKAIRDIGGVAAGNSDRIFSDPQKIEKIFENTLLPHEVYYLASEEKDPQGLLWPAIRDKYFLKVGRDRWQFYRYPSAPRTFAVDLAITGDCLGFSLNHSELDAKTGQVIDVTDITIPIIPNKKRINMDAIVCLVEDLVSYGGMNILAGSFDGFHSEPALQRLRRKGIEMERLSADQPPSIYLNFIASINRGTYKSGRSVFLKNNLKSLKFSQTPKSKQLKIDHENGVTVNTVGFDTSWERSSYGFFGKDVSDTVCTSIELLRKYQTSPPTVFWDADLQETLEGEFSLALDIAKSKTLYKLGLLVG